MVVVSWVGGREDKRFYFDALTFHFKSKSAQRWGVWYVHCACIEGKKLSLILKSVTDFLWKAIIFSQIRFEQEDWHIKLIFLLISFFKGRGRIFCFEKCFIETSQGC